MNRTWLAPLVVLVLAGCRSEIDVEILAPPDWTPIGVSTLPALSSIGAGAVRKWESPPPSDVGPEPYTPRFVATSGRPACLVAIGDVLNRRVHVFTATGEHLRTVVLQQRSPAPIEHLSGIALDPSGALLAVDNVARTVMLWSNARADEHVVISLADSYGPAATLGIAFGPDGVLVEALAPRGLAGEMLPAPVLLRDRAGRPLHELGEPELLPSDRFTAALSEGLLAAGPTGILWIAHLRPVAILWRINAASGGWPFDSITLDQVGFPRVPAQRMLTASVEENALGGITLPFRADRLIAGAALDELGRAILIRVVTFAGDSTQSSNPALTTLQAIQGRELSPVHVELGTVRSVALEPGAVHLVRELPEDPLLESRFPVREVVSISDTLFFGRRAAETSCAGSI